MTTALRFVGGAVIGAAAMYWFDPRVGRRRRALLRDQMVSKSHSASNAVSVGSRDLAHRAAGAAAKARSLFGSRRADDVVLTERVRAALGRVVSHPHAIDVRAEDGHIVLRGPILESEHGALLKAIREVRGVRQVEDQLVAHRHAEGVPALQGGRPRGVRSPAIQESWAPATRLISGVAGLALLAGGLRSRSLLGVMATAAGGGLLLRSTANQPLPRLAGIGGRRAVEIRKSMDIRAPVEQVFRTIEDFESWPTIMRNVRSVRRQRDGRWHWTVRGPVGLPVEWESELTEFRPGELIAWHTVRHSPVRHAGSLRFTPVAGGTHVDLQMSYTPPGGLLGHLVARLSGADPRTELDQDLVRLKTFIETGRRPRDAARREPEGVLPELQARDEDMPLSRGPMESRVQPLH